MNEDRIYEMLSELKVGQATTNERLAHYNASLDEHIKRTELLEARQDEFEKQTNQQLEVAILPIKSIKWLSSVGAGLVILFTVLKNIGIIK